MELVADEAPPRTFALSEDGLAALLRAERNRLLVAIMATLLAALGAAEIGGQPTHYALALLASAAITALLVFESNRWARSHAGLVVTVDPAGLRRSANGDPERRIAPTEARAVTAGETGVRISPAQGPALDIPIQLDGYADLTAALSRWPSYQAARRGWWAWTVLAGLASGALSLSGYRGAWRMPVAGAAIGAISAAALHLLAHPRVLREHRQLLPVLAWVAATALKLALR